MEWMFTAAILGGVVVGFIAGASRVSTGGPVAAAVAALQLGIFGFVSKPDPNRPIDIALVGKLFVLFLAALTISYIGANVARRHGRLIWMGISKK